MTTDCRLDFRNVNTLWATVLAETLARLGLTTAVICPGSRSAPLTIAFAQHPRIRAIPVLDERSASFFALGMARRTHRPVVLVCTSGTAGANFYPAVIEARESRVPLLVLTADRPPELRGCHAGQAIDQQKLFGSFANGYAELAVPEVELLGYLRQTVVQAWGQALYPVAGPVHLNVPLRDPLVPVVDGAMVAREAEFDAADFFAAVLPTIGDSLEAERSPIACPQVSTEFFRSDRGLILVGPVQPADPGEYARAIAQLSQMLGYPVLAEGLSPLRNFAEVNPNLIAGYDLILRNAAAQAGLVPEVVIQVGDLPTSKVLRTWLTGTRSRHYVVDAGGGNLDALHGQTIHLRVSVAGLVRGLAGMERAATGPSAYLKGWREAERQVQAAIALRMKQTSELVESKVAWLLAQVLPADTPILISNSMPVRDVEFFWTPNGRRVVPYCNRGANGIDGTLSTALGVADGGRGVLLTGDLALLHDTNGFLLRSHFQGHLTIVLINNNGGGIFEMLPVAQFDPPFEEFFATPQSIDFGKLCATYGVEYEGMGDWQQLRDRLYSLPEGGIRVLEVRSDRRRDAAWRKRVLGEIAGAIGL